MEVFERIAEIERRLSLLTSQLLELRRAFEGHCHGFQIEGSHEEWERKWQEMEERKLKAEAELVGAEVDEWREFKEWQKAMKEGRR